LTAEQVQAHQCTLIKQEITRVIVVISGADILSAQ
jgi:hypothetical protein